MDPPASSPNDNRPLTPKTFDEKYDSHKIEEDKENEENAQKEREKYGPAKEVFEKSPERSETQAARQLLEKYINESKAEKDMEMDDWVGIVSNRVGEGREQRRQE